jgi:hypothetical protein
VTTFTESSGGAQLAHRALTAVQAVDRDFVQTVPNQPALLSALRLLADEAPRTSRAASAGAGQPSAGSPDHQR